MNKETKKYRLKRDTPESKTGDVYIYTKSCGSYAYFKDGNTATKHWYFVENVENNTEWFEEVVEPIEQDAFVWTDALVKEFIIDRNNGKTYAPVYVDDYIRQFKQSKFTQPEVDAIRKELEVTEQLLNERQRVLDAIPECPGHGRNCVPHALAWIEKMLRTKQSTQPVEEAKDWQVISLIADYGGHNNVEYVYNPATGFYVPELHQLSYGFPRWTLKDVLENENGKIKSVRRLSDNTSLNVGQITDYGRITGFNVYGDHLMAAFENGSRMTNIKNINLV